MPPRQATTPPAGSPSPTRSDVPLSTSSTDEPVTDHGGGLVRVRLDIAYDGTTLHGWARQPAVRTVQGDLELALATVLRHDVDLTVAGRTDAGVHATGQVAHLDLPVALWQQHARKLLRRLRGVLAPDIAVTCAEPAPAGFDARFAALGRHYAYRLTDAVSGSPPLRRLDTAAWPRRLDVPAMRVAAALLLGQHDFAAFCRRREGATTIRVLQELDVRREDDLVTVSASADAFCHSMVRSLVGALLAVGEGRRDPGWPAGLLARTSRADEVPVAPAGGLTLLAVDYPPDDQLAARALVTRARRDA